MLFRSRKCLFPSNTPYRTCEPSSTLIPRSNRTASAQEQEPGLQQFLTLSFLQRSSDSIYPYPSLLPRAGSTTGRDAAAAAAAAAFLGPGLASLLLASGCLAVACEAREEAREYARLHLPAPRQRPPRVALPLHCWLLLAPSCSEGQEEEGSREERVKVGVWACACVRCEGSDR